MSRRPRWFSALALVCVVVVTAALILLGNWQLRRLAWKVDLIDAVEARAFQAPVAAPAGRVTRRDHAYLRVTLEGRFLHEKSRRVKALTELGSGAWLMTPLALEGREVWINRGFVPSGFREIELYRPQGTQTVTGLVRITEPGGTLLEANDAERGRWFSRDVAALSQAVGLSKAATYFVDADHASDAPLDSWPRGGLTQTKFRNSHFSYALTWYALAVLLLGATAYVLIKRPHD